MHVICALQQDCHSRALSQSGAERGERTTGKGGEKKTARVEQKTERKTRETESYRAGEKKKKKTDRQRGV